MSHVEVIIPTFNNAAVVGETVRQLTSQAVPPNWSVTLALTDDGSNNATVRTVRACLAGCPWPHRLLVNPHRGVAAARNCALAASTADVILLLGADILLQQGALKGHLAFHDAHPEVTAAALGFIQWDPRLPPTPFMEWMVHGGSQNDFDRLLGLSQADPAHFWYASHLSAKRVLLQQVPFWEGFTRYGWEDHEQGRRLLQAGVTLHVLHDARALHQHAYTWRDIRKRQYDVGYNLVRYQGRYPALTLLRKRSYLASFFHTLGSVLGFWTSLWFVVGCLGNSYSLPRLFSILIAESFWRGVAAARSQT